MANTSILTDRPARSAIIDDMFKSDRPRTIDHYIDYFGGDGLSSLGDLGGHEAVGNTLEAEEQTV